MRHQPDIDKIYLYVKDLHESKYQLLINKLEKLATLKHLLKTRTIYKIPIKKLMIMTTQKNAKKLITFDNMIADMISNKKSIQ